MIREVLVNEPADVLVRVSSNGTVTPTSFLWRGKTRYVGDLGRQWEERVDGKSLRCYLLKTVDENTYELRWDPAANSWSVHRAWLHDLLV
ncbi:MAG TPA: hypothetical protein PKE45_04175 [Caldilineaceae bacterium]|nr:hypothetical protein [Caldilineaceae bacterium]